MLSQGGDTDLLEQVLSLVLMDDLKENDEVSEDFSLLDWLKLLSECSQFGMMIQLASEELLAKVEAKLETGSSDVEALKEKYQRKRRT